jgi:AraC-like DNA-binding protein
VPAVAAASSNLTDCTAGTVCGSSRSAFLTIDAVSMYIGDLVRLRKAKDRMDREFDRPLNVPAIAQSAAMSTGHFSRSFKAAFGESPYSYLMTRRIERAKALLRRGDMSVTDVCFAVGCTSLGSFSSRFTELVGDSPSAYRARSHSPVEFIPPCIIMVMTKPIRNEEAVASKLS